MKFEQFNMSNQCPEGGDTANDCADCIYSDEYHCVNGDCVLRSYDPSEIKFNSPKEVD